MKSRKEIDPDSGAHQENGIQVENVYLRLMHDTDEVHFHTSDNPSAVPFARQILHSHPFSELFFCENGPITLKISGGTFPMEPGDVVIIPAKTEHVKLPSAPDVVWHSISFSCFQRQLRGCLDLFRDYKQFLTGNDPLVFHHRQDLIPRLSRLVEDTILHPSRFLALTLADILGSLIQPTSESADTQENEETDPQIDDVDIIGSTRLEHMIASQFMNDLTTQSAAEQFYISTRQLDRISVKYYGMTFRRAVINRRLRVAMEMFNTTQMTIEQISTSVGFTSRLSFARAFAAQYGMSPSQYRKHLDRQTEGGDVPAKRPYHSKKNKTPPKGKEDQNP